jgi:aryl-alcohol dehydrogenase-like predicted oxidoreductase
MIETTFPLNGHPVHRMGFGAMQLPGPGVFGPPRDRDEAIAVLRRAVELGVDHIDTSQYYGPDVANELIRDALYPYPDGLRIATKVGARRGPNGEWLPAMRPEEIRAGVEDNLRTLRVERMDLVNLRLVAGEVPDQDDAPTMAESLGALVDLRDEGKVDLIGLSAVTLSDLDEAGELTEIAGVQNVFNLFERGHADLLATTRERGMAFVPFFPLGSAFGEGHARIADQPEVQRVAAKHDATPAQVALAWLLALSPNILLIPGTSSLAHLEENLAGAKLELDEADLEALAGVVSR